MRLLFLFFAGYVCLYQIQLVVLLLIGDAYFVEVEGDNFLVKLISLLRRRLAPLV